MGEFNSDDHYIYYCGQESLRRNGVALIVNKRVQNVVLGCNLKNNRMISVCFQGKPFNITVIQVYAPTMLLCQRSWSQTVLWEPTRPSRTSTKKDVLFIIGAWKAKVGNQELPGVTGKFGLGVQNEAGQRITVLPRECPLPTTQEMTLHMDITRWSVPKSDWLFLGIRRWRNSTQSAKTRPGSDCGSDHELLIAKFRLWLKKIGKNH